MRNKSEKQKKIDSILSRYKSTMVKTCAICGRPGNELSHILPRSLYPEYVTDERNLQILCGECHYKFDNNRAFRKAQTRIINKAKSIDELATNRYFNL